MAFEAPREEEELSLGTAARLGQERVRRQDRLGSGIWAGHRPLPWESLSQTFRQALQEHLCQGLKVF